MQLLVYGFEAFCKLITTNIVKQINCPIQIGIDFEIVPICGFHFPRRENKWPQFLFLLKKALMHGDLTYANRSQVQIVRNA